MGQRFGGEIEGETTARYVGGDSGGLRLFVGWVLFFYFDDVMRQLLFCFLFTHSASCACGYRSLSTADLVMCIRCVFVRKMSIYIGKLEIVMGVEFIFYLAKHMGTKVDMAFISQSFGLVKEKDGA